MAMLAPLRIRQATEADAPALVRIYAPYVEETPITFETVVPQVEEFAQRIRTSLTAWQYLVAERDGGVVGYAYGGTHRARAAYRYSVEVSAYIDRSCHRQGIGRALYTRLFEDLAAKGYCEAFAGITYPNEPSIGLHSAMGFTMIGIFRRTGWKFDRWHDVAWMQRTLREGAPPIRT
jgi:L-amino acid N-acyltransferase YncA